MKKELEQKKVCFLLTHVPNPRMNKRIEIFKNVAETKVICTRRASQNIWEPAQDVEHIIFDIDLPSAKHLLKRYIVSLGFQKKAIEKIAEINPDVIYAEGLDSLIIAGQYGKKHDVTIIFEVADLRENYIVQPAAIVQRILTKLLLKREKKAFKNVDFLVVTSPKFYDMHYASLIKDRVVFVPNAPNVEIFQDYKKKKSGNFTVGFIGGIRYLKQMKMLADAAKAKGIDVLFAGAGGTSSEYQEILEYCKDMQNVRFSGRYNYEEEIAKLYGMVDCVFSVYDADNPNVRIALPNKLYEAVLCELPIIVAKGTYLSELVAQYGVGISVSHKDQDELEMALEKLKNDNNYRESFAEKCRMCREEMIDAKQQAETLAAIVRKD